MNIPVAGPDRTATLERMHDAIVRDACLSWSGLVARGWDPHEARQSVAGWVATRTVQVLDELDGYVAGGVL